MHTAQSEGISKPIERLSIGLADRNCRESAGTSEREATLGIDEARGPCQLLLIRGGWAVLGHTSVCRPVLTWKEAGTGCAGYLT